MRNADSRISCFFTSCLVLLIFINDRSLAKLTTVRQKIKSCIGEFSIIFYYIFVKEEGSVEAVGENLQKMLGYVM